MTIIVGWRTSEGIVLGSDSQTSAFSGQSDQMGILKGDTDSKVDVYDHKLITGFSGKAGFAQQCNVLLHREIKSLTNLMGDWQGFGSEVKRIILPVGVNP